MLKSIHQNQKNLKLFSFYIFKCRSFPSSFCFFAWHFFVPLASRCSLCLLTLFLFFLLGQLQWQRVQVLSIPVCLDICAAVYPCATVYCKYIEYIFFLHAVIFSVLVPVNDDGEDDGMNTCFEHTHSTWSVNKINAIELKTYFQLHIVFCICIAIGFPMHLSNWVHLEQFLGNLIRIRSIFKYGAYKYMEK